MMTDVKQNLPLLRTSLKLRFTIVAVISSDVDPLGIGFPIPANDNLGIYNDLVLGVASDAMESELFSLNRSSVSQY
jgi:ribosomal protein S2